MNEERKTYMADEDIENLLSPKCVFHTSPGFMERVIAEAQAVSKRRKRRRILFAATSAAAAVAVLVILTVIIHDGKEAHSEMPIVTSNLETPALAPADTLYESTSSELITEAAPPNIKISADPKMSPTKSVIIKEPHLSQSVIEEVKDESELYAVTEGEMPMINRKKSLDPDEVRARLIETRRNAEIAYIEQVRNEIEANQAYIAQLMNEENVYK